MRWLVTGARGMLGLDLVELVERSGETVTATDRNELDITDATAVFAAVSGHDVVVNCAAWTNVDAAEEHEPEAFAINAVGPAHLARAAAACGSRLVQISTDYVFGGRARTPFAEDDVVAPANAYARTKLAGEWAVRASGADALVLRTAWLYGAHGPSFPAAIARRLLDHGAAEVVDDQRGQPTWTCDVADLVLRLVRAGAPAGTYHATSGGEATWFDFARAVAVSFAVDPECVRPTTSDLFLRPAKRPAYSVLAHDALDRAGIAPIGGWADRWSAAQESMKAAVLAG